MLPTERKTLLLNADGRPLTTYPISFISAEDAIKAVYKDRAFVLEEWEEVFRSPSTTIKVPKVLMLRQYAPIDSQPKFCRRSILLRDRFSCQYCGEKFDSSELTYDHLIPRSAGGTTCWENILTACIACNSAKKDSMPEFSGRKGKKGSLLRPLKLPRRPTTSELLRNGLECLDNDLREEFASYLYWSVPLDT